MTSAERVVREVIVEGYLLKSRRSSFLWNTIQGLSCVKSLSKPPVTRLRKRYCVLYKIRKQNLTEVFFEYYKDSACSKFLGRVDLKNCVCIQNGINISGSSYGFSVEIASDEAKRTYYFVASSLNSMIHWVQNLVDVTRLVDFTSEEVPIRTPVPSPFSKQVGCATSVPSAGRFDPVRSSSNGPSLTSTIVDARTKRTVCPISFNNPDDDDYRNLNENELDYLGSGSEEDYRKLPSASHTYVNLVNQMDQDYQFLNNLTGINNMDKKTQNSLSETLKRGDEHKPVAERRTSTDDSVYYNVWEAGTCDSEQKTTEKSIKNIRLRSPAPLPEVVKWRHDLSSIARVYRRSHIIPTNVITQSTSVSITSRKPISTPRVVNTPNCMVTHKNQASTLPLLIPTMSTEAWNDSALPVRTPATVRDLGDDSSSSGSNNSLISEMPVHDDVEEEDNEANSSNIVKDPCPLTKFDPSDNETSCSLTSHPSLKQDPKNEINAKKLNQLNYIEPCNLDLGPPNLNGSCTPNALYNPSFKSDPNGILSNSNYFNVCSSINNSISHVNPISSWTGNPCSKDYEIEYREIDPISTNALAIVTKQYLDGDNDLLIHNSSGV